MIAGEGFVLTRREAMQGMAGAALGAMVQDSFARQVEHQGAAP